MRTRIIHTKIWKDEYIANLTLSEKMLFFYLLTNEKVNIIHCYELSEREISFDTGIDRGIIAKAKVKFEKDNKMKFFKDYIFLINANKYETYTGEKNEEAKRKLIKEMSESVLDWYNNIKDTPIDTPIDRVSIPSINHNTEIINQEEGIVKGRGDIKLFLEEFNKNFKTKYRPTNDRKEKLRLRLKTFTFEEILTALQNLSSDPFSKGENDRDWIADPDYLLRSDGIVDKFLNKKKTGGLSNFPGAIYRGKASGN